MIAECRLARQFRHDEFFFADFADELVIEGDDAFEAAELAVGEAGVADDFFIGFYFAANQ